MRTAYNYIFKLMCVPSLHKERTLHPFKQMNLDGGPTCSHPLFIFGQIRLKLITLRRMFIVYFVNKIKSEKEVQGI